MEKEANSPHTSCLFLSAAHGQLTWAINFLLMDMGQGHMCVCVYT